MRVHIHTHTPPPKTNEESLYIQSEALVYFAASGYIGALSALLVVSFSACLIDDCRVVALFFFFNFLHSPALIYPVSKGNLPHTWQHLKLGRSGMNSSCGKGSTLP